LALAVPLSRFTPRVGGGSAFFVRRSCVYPMNQAEPSPNLPPLAKCVPGIAQSLALCGLYWGVSIAVTIALLLLQRFANVPMSSGWVQLVIAWPLTFWVGLRWSKVSFRQACPLTRFPVRIVPALLIASFGVIILVNAAASLIPRPEAPLIIPLPEALTKKDMSESMAGSSKLALFFSSFFSDVLVAPLAEEFFFRGLVLRGYLGRYSMTKAAWASAVFFAVFHLNPWQAVVVLLPGLGFTWLFLRTGSLVPGILSHATVNFSVSFLLALGYDLEASHCPPSLLAIAGAMAGIGGFFLWRQLAKPPNERSA